MPVHPAARAAARELAGMGIPLLTLDEADQILDAADMIPKPDATASDIVLGTPVRVGSVVLYPPTIAAVDLLLRLGTDDPLATPFALAHGREPEKLDAIITRADLRREITAFRRRAGATSEELLAASALAQGIADASGDAARLEALEDAADILADTAPDLADAVRKEARTVYAAARTSAAEETPATARAVLAEQRNALARLAAICGVPPSHWRGEEAAVVWQIYRHALEAEAQRAAVAASAFGAMSGAPSKSAHQTAEAVRAMRRVIVRIAQAHKQREASDVAKDGGNFKNG